MKCLDRFSEDHGHNSFKTILKGRSQIDEFTLTNGFSLLLCGPPGAGKTTFGLYLLNRIFRQPAYMQSFAPEDNGPRALILSFVETANQIQQLCKAYDLNFGAENLEVGSLIAEIPFGLGDEPDLKKISDRHGFNLKPPRLLLVDGISVLGTHHDYRGKYLSLIRQAKEIGLISILIAEDFGGNQDNFLQYAVDGVIVFSCNAMTGMRYLEVKKLRWHDYYMGTHAFRLHPQHSSPITPSKRCILFFPSVSCLIAERSKNPSTLLAKESGVTFRMKGLSSGVEGFDQIATGKEGNGTGSTDGPFRPGEQVLLIGPSGSGKFLFGTQFLAAGRADEKIVFVSFVHNIVEFQERMTICASRNTADCDSLFFNPIGLVLEEMFGTIHNLLSVHESSVVRLFVDGISAIRFLFDKDEQFESFMLSFIQLLGSFPNVAALVSYYSPRVFASYREIDIPASEHFSTVIGFNFQEQFNKLVPGIVILKSQTTGFDTISLRVPKVTDGIYWIDLQAGWTNVGLLGGQAEQIHAEIPFIKVFFENSSEEEVLEVPLSGFGKRYPHDHIFRWVAKPNPHPEHWSFKGYHGPGHSNTKLVELRKYVMDVLRENNVFLDVPESSIRGFEERLREGFLWNDSTRMLNQACKMVPFYADVGVLTYQEDALGGLGLSIPATWNDLIKQAEKFNASKKQYNESRALHQKIHHLFTIPNAVLESKNFVSFFFELSWTHGWEFPNRDCHELRSDEKIRFVGNELRNWINSDFFNRSLKLLRKLIEVGKSWDDQKDAIPNPNVGGHYHGSVFSRRWFSKIHLFSEDAQRRAAANQSAFRFGISPLPAVDEAHLGISNVDLYAIGIIRNALAPETGWMLVASLLEYGVDVDRAKRKRGLPVSRKIFGSQLVQDNLGACPPAPGSKDDFYSSQDSLFKEYNTVISRIVDPKEGKPLFRRTSDIPRFFYLEQALAKHLPALFDDPPRAERDVKDALIKAITEIYANDNII